YCELVNLGFNLQWLDVGGGLGVDYEGSRSRRFCSMNYSINEYARNIVHTLKSVCHQAGVAFPHIMTEAGRAMTAHHATILSEVFDSESVPVANPQEPAPGSPECLRRMWRSHQDIQSSNALNLVELYHELCEGLAELRSASVHGLIRLEQRAQGETIYHSTLLALSAKLKPSNRSSKEIIDEISNATVDKLFINLSIFRSLPDVWGIDQVFPIVPIEHLDKALTRQVVVQDVTCDSDGRIDQYVDGDDIEASLPVAEENLKPGSLYGFFLAGAYQEILGDNHNLFGEIDTVDVELGPDGSVSFSYPEKGDSIACVLESVHFSEGSLNTVYQDHISGLHVEPDKKQALRDAFSSAVCSSPYLSKN
ncbi:MAG: biosynthetic arginine decarboxylase, partial [Gammaproteobacteria bacterium]|nr:biosynthetic arginine decarboxylase [Gammaproteobacteria bacterium]